MNEFRVGVDVGGTKTAYGLFDDKNNIVDRAEHPSPTDLDGRGFSDLLIEGIRGLCARNGLEVTNLRGIGVCMPSYILFDTGYIYLTSSLVKIRDFAMRDYLTERLNVPIVLDNDSNGAALVEHRYGAGKGSRDMVYMAISTGIGSGLILNGELYRGSYGWAGESGHMLITPDQGVECGCRNKGCFMSWASGRYFPDHIRRLAEGRETVIDLNGALDGRAVLDACKKGDQVAFDVLAQSARNIALCVYNIYMLLNVNLFVFGGGLTQFGDMLLSRVREEFDRYNQIPLPVDFRVARLQKDVGIIGAAELINC